MGHDEEDPVLSPAHARLASVGVPEWALVGYQTQRNS